MATWNCRRKETPKLSIFPKCIQPREMPNIRGLAVCACPCTILKWPRKQQCVTSISIQQAAPTVIIYKMRRRGQCAWIVHAPSMTCSELTKSTMKYFREVFHARLSPAIMPKYFSANVYDNNVEKEERMRNVLLSWWNKGELLAVHSIDAARFYLPRWHSENRPN